MEKWISQTSVSSVSTAVSVGYTQHACLADQCLSSLLHTSVFPATPNQSLLLDSFHTHREHIINSSNAIVFLTSKIFDMHSFMAIPQYLVLELKPCCF